MRILITIQEIKKYQTLKDGLLNNGEIKGVRLDIKKEAIFTDQP